jgi:phosphoserine phosphatase
VLITGALDRLIAPLAPLFDDIVCASLEERDGILTGQLTEVPPTGETRAQALYDHCALHGIDPGDCVAYADSTSDLPLLEAVGYPVAVNPETRLASLARKRGWLVEQFAPVPGGPTPLLPLARRRPPTTTAATAGRR